MCGRGTGNHSIYHQQMFDESSVGDIKSVGYKVCISVCLSWVGHTYYTTHTRRDIVYISPV